MHRRERNRRIVTASTVALLAGMLLSESGFQVAAEPNVVLDQLAGTPVTASSAVVAPDIVGAAPTISGDGRFVVFQGAPPVEVEGRESDRASTVYLADRASGETIELSPVPDGVRSGDTVLPVISGDGCVVAALTEMPLDVFRDDDREGRWDVYRSVLPHCDGQVGDWELVSTRPGTGGLSRDDVVLDPPTIDRGGTVVAYTHPADHYFEARSVTAVSVVDATVPAGDPLRTRFAAGLPVDMPDNPFEHSGLDQPVLSDDGRFLAYRSSATSGESVPGWGTGPIEGGPATTQIFVWDRADADPFTAVRLVSRTADGAPTALGASEPDLSRDGSVVAYVSADPMIVPDVEFPVCSANCPSQVYVVDRDADGDGLLGGPGDQITRLVSSVTSSDEPTPGLDAGTIAGTAPSSQPALSGDGELVAFTTKATNLQLVEVPSVGGGADGDILLAHLARGTLERLTVNPDNSVVPAAGLHAHPALSDSGRTAVFDTGVAGALTGAVIAPPVEPGDAIDGDAEIEPGDVMRRVVARSLPPQLSLPDADLGTTVVGVEGDEWYVAVINDGPSSFLPAEVTISNPQFVINAEASTCLLGAAVPAGGNCTVAMSYTPTRPGASSAVLRVAEGGFDAVAIESNIAGAGGQPTLRIEPPGADLGASTVGTSGVEFQFDVSNISPVAPTTLTDFEISGAHASDFEFTTNACLDRPLNPRASCSVGITFTPTAEGRRTALVTVGTPEGQYTTMVIAGDGRFEPSVEIARVEVEAGGAFIATADGFAAGEELTVVFSDASDEPVVVTADENGSLFVQLEVPPSDLGGDRTLVVQSADGVAASSSIQVRAVDTELVGMPGFGLG